MADVGAPVASPTASAPLASAPPIAPCTMQARTARTLFSPARHKCLYGGRGGAKSWSVATYLAIIAAKDRKKIVCARQFQNSIRDSSKELVEQRIDALGMRAEFAVTDRAITHAATGSEFLFVGLERNIDSIRSLEGADIVWIEEARTINARSMEILLPTVRKQGSELIWTWNPEQPTDPVDAYFRSGDPPPRSIITCVDYTSNPYFFQTEMPAEVELMRRRNPDRYKHIWLGDYDTRYESKVFPNVTTGRVEIPVNCPALFGLDFGFGADPTFVVKLYVLDRTKQIYVAAEATGRAAMDQLPSMIRSVCPHDGTLIKADSSNPGAIEFLCRRGLNVIGARKGQGSIESGILFLQGYQIVIDPGCEAMRDEARLYSWAVDPLTRKVLPGNPIDAHNHGVDACRYATEDLAYSGALAEDADPSGGVLWLKNFW